MNCLVYVCAIVVEEQSVQQETEHGNPTLEAFDPSFFYSAFQSAKLDYYVHHMFTFVIWNAVRNLVNTSKLQIAF